MEEKNSLQPADKLSAQKKSFLSDFLRDYFSFGLAGVLIGTAFLFPQTWVSLFLGWFGTISFCVAMKSSRQVLLGLFLNGIVLSVIGFYWLIETVHFFGGFSYFLAVLIFALFCGYSALQFILCGLLGRILTWGRAGSFGVISFSCFVVELLMPRIFPWCLAHTQIVWTSFSGLAEFGGASALSWWMLLWGEAIASAILKEPRSWFRIGFLGFMSAVLVAIGSWRTAEINELMVQAPTLRVALIQGNLDAKEKGDIKYYESNISRYRELSQKAVSEGAELILWPESVVTAWAPENASAVSGEEFAPLEEDGINLLYGGLSYALRPETELADIVGKAYGGVSESFRERLRIAYYNTAFGIDKSGAVLGRYHKRVLMPFGEFIPFARRFPLLQDLSPQTGDFDSGKIAEPISFKLASKTPSGESEGQEVKVMPLICYEDLVADLARHAVLRGAQVLVNLTNDAWYGKSAAPYQHNLLAAWRAIETRRFLLRVTNTGYTTVVDPLGKTIKDLDLFTADYLLADIKALSVETIYVRYGAYVVIFIAFIGFVFARAFKKLG